ncbi:MULTISPECIES: hypothetical protein [unclassified Cryobacterium]|uniref:hypothetical protein n=1 Tax=unclassified Cryobacterium TaxID=2649013 RepID=UPI001F53EBC8|nr:MULTISPECIES: hypothetical protein [unclassified Cryobacterium]
MSTEPKMSAAPKTSTELTMSIAPKTGAESKTIVVPVEPAKSAPRSKAELRGQASDARAELARTLDAIEYKLNLPKQFRYKSRRAVLRLRRMRDENPLALAGLAAVAAAVLGGSVWLGANAVRRR